MDLRTIVDRLDDELRIADFADVDASANGLQVGDRGEVEHVAVAVDAAIETIERAADAGADLLVTHHGLIWDGLERVTGRDYRRIAACIESDLALYVAHLPLDGHQDLGNAAGLCAGLDLERREPFGSLGGEHIGQRGQFAEPVETAAFRDRLAAATETDHDVQLFDFGPDPIETVGVVTGSGVDWLEEAAESGIDAFVTGEGKQHLFHDAKEREMTVALAGHYATETFGVRALAQLASEWGLETTYIDCPTGL